MSAMTALPPNLVLKRSLSVTSYAIIASSVGGVFAFFAVLTLWLVIRGILRRRKRVQVRISGPLTVEHEEARQALRLLAHAKHPSIISAATKGFTPHPQRRYTSEESALKVPDWRLSGGSTSTTSTESSVEDCRPTAKKCTREYLQKPIAVVTQPLLRNGTRRRSLDADTASIYSSTSAPLDYHEKLFCTPLMALDPNVPVSAPAWITSTPSQRADFRYSVIEPVAHDLHRPPARRVQFGSNRRISSTRRTKRQPTITITPSSTRTSIPAWSRRAEHLPPTRIQWLVPTAEQRGALSGAISQPVADKPSLPSPPPATYPSVAPLNVRSKTVRNVSISSS
ncbi:hypothetical protein BDY19DRAFT_989628 [Irpex rosettiformis]|uniref:Uncharacterized protein n=1 Tax=Irpex rosettiformis TaxID=378272 RepID=A0ACB8UF80_9APHY|nr:hypothetical protein BDY19DRAFT_989628 [Irpex rosettiformis]